MEAEYIKRLGELYRAAKSGDDSNALSLTQKAMEHMMVAEAAMTSMMVAESLALEALKPHGG
ncbi:MULTISPECIES: hypothetical protein [unclassified Mesorhizobium]|uniref:hypothetical protein n=1 Tax=unclassified Mesorhizobium TaxID=325217 RepID=UPI00109186F3|nr:MULTISPECIES: hypothetical protein [unclassified Mesorhizobium]TGP89080.1 hypothetical protein EN861_27955 [Mesorhizobium sp. M8A.F.Ca.ET.218.01.1.1]TGT16243.1 hypothetical protein EN856_27490 [Mesorhizobium sp. M8A.F.Ca.ET.213.01.1.1]